MHTGGCRLDFELLEKLNQLELQNQISKNLGSSVNMLESTMKSDSSLKPENYTRQYFEKVLKWCPERVSKIKDLISPTYEYLWSQPNKDLLSESTTSPEILQEFLNICKNKLNESDFGDPTRISQVLEEFVATHKLKQKTFLKDLRIILCGTKVICLLIR